MAIGIVSGALGTVLIVLGILIVIYIIFKLGKWIIGMIVNAILGFVAIYLLNLLFQLGIPWDWITIIITAIAGLPGVALIVILKLLGVAI